MISHLFEGHNVLNNPFSEKKKKEKENLVAGHTYFMQDGAYLKEITSFV